MYGTGGPGQTGLGSDPMVANERSATRTKQVYVSPSDTIMSPCTAKLSAYKSKQFGK